MSTKNPVGFCPNCNQKVLLHRGQIDTLLAIILLFFTAGFGLIIYLIIYYSKPEIYCVHCGTECQQKIPTQQIGYQPVQRPYDHNVQYLSDDNGSYCPLCGSKLNLRNQRFCPNCGAEL